MRQELINTGRKEFNILHEIVETISVLRNKIEKVERYDPVLKDEIKFLIDKIQNLIYKLR